MNYKEIINARGYVINSFVNVELIINTIISVNYLGRVDSKFILDVLNNEMSSFGFKKAILRQVVGTEIFDKGKGKGKLEKINKIRNLFGHAVLSVKNGKMPDDPAAEFEFVDPKSSTTTINPKEKLDEFNGLLNEAENWLYSIAKMKGVTGLPC